MFEAILFYIFALLAIGGGVSVISLRSPIYSTLSLLLTMFSLAALFLLMQATFVAVIHIAVYAGAIIILFLFVIMLMGIKQVEIAKVNLAYKTIGIIGTLFLTILLGKAMLLINANTATNTESVVGSAKALGHLLFTQYLLPFELISLLILVAIIGAVYLGSKKA